MKSVSQRVALGSLVSVAFLAFGCGTQTASFKEGQAASKSTSTRTAEQALPASQDSSSQVAVDPEASKFDNAKASMENIVVATDAGQEPVNGSADAGSAIDPTAKVVVTEKAADSVPKTDPAPVSQPDPVPPIDSAPPIDPGPDPEKILVEDGGKLDIPGVKVAKVGVNFEDHSDSDYNDSVLCFTGDFKVDGTEVVSYKEQEIVASVFSASGCQHEVTIEIIDESGSKQTQSYNDSVAREVTLKFGINSKLNVTMKTIHGFCDASPRSMHKAEFAKVELDVCRNTGH